MIRRCGALTMTATNVSCGTVTWRRATTLGSTVYPFHVLPSFFLLTKRSLHSVTLQRATLSDTNGDIGSEKSSKDRLRTFAYRGLHEG